MTMKMAELAQRAKEQLEEVTGFTPVAVVGTYQDKEGWHITVDLLEMARLPEATDILGTYVITLNQEGNMAKFEKRGSRLRAQPYDEEGE